MNSYKVKDNEKLYRTWSRMKQKCYNTKDDRYYRYGAKGTRVCELWMNSFNEFAEWSFLSGGYYTQEVTTEYRDMLTIDRIDNKGNYEPSNCQWIPFSENASKDRIKIDEFQALEIYTKYNYNNISVRELAKEYSVSLNTIYTTLRKLKKIEEDDNNV